MVLVQVPDLASFELLTALCSFFLLFYCTAAMALAGVQGERGEGRWLGGRARCPRPSTRLSSEASR